MSYTGVLLDFDRAILSNQVVTFYLFRMELCQRCVADVLFPVKQRSFAVF